ncbi:hypothetical protein [Nocardia sp. NPDC049149]|uniref:hypothetical protein n=1 Tax=Nocardia sp. NPDC049149 TaxID=3364315 RepID=UPI00371442D5
MRAILLAAAAVLAVEGLAGCGNSTPATPGAQPPNAPATSAAPQQPSAPSRNTAPAKPTAPSRDNANVDARDYQQGDAFYFQSPSGNILCGFNVAGAATVGCQVMQATAVPAELPDCGTRPNRTVGAEINGTTAKFRCFSQGVYVGSPIDGGSKGGGRVLPYDSTLVVRGAACTSTQAGVRCDVGGHGFVLAAEAQSLF